MFLEKDKGSCQKKVHVRMEAFDAETLREAARDMGVCIQGRIQKNSESGIGVFAYGEKIMRNRTF